MGEAMTRDQLVRSFLRHEAMLKEFILALVRDPHDADDVFQEVGVRILSQAEPPREPDRFPAWCRGIARNVLLHHWRSRRRGQAFHERFANVVETAYQEADAEGEEWNDHRIALADCLKKVPEESRRVLDLRYAEGLLSGEIARRLERSATAVRMLIMRVREGLDACVRRRLAARPDGGLSV